MYIKKISGTAIINFNHFDGILIEKCENGRNRLHLFKTEGESSFAKLTKSTLCIGAFSEEQIQQIMAEIEECLKNHETVYILPEPEEQHERKND